MDMIRKYRVGNTPILHDGKRVDPGDEVELTDKDAQALGAHVTPTEPAETQDPKKGKQR